MPALTDSRGTVGLLTLSGSCGYSWSSLGIGSPRRPASRLLAANRDMVFRVPKVALPMWGRITGKGRKKGG